MWSAFDNSSWRKGLKIMLQVNLKKRAQRKVILTSFERCLHYVKSVQIQSLFWTVFPRIRTEYGEIRSISVFSPNTKKYGPKKNFVFGNISRSVHFHELFEDYAKTDKLCHGSLYTFAGLFIVTLGFSNSNILWVIDKINFNSLYYQD